MREHVVTPMTVSWPSYAGAEDCLDGSLRLMDHETSQVPRQPFQGAFALLMALGGFASAWLARTLGAPWPLGLGVGAVVVVLLWWVLFHGRKG